MDKIERMRAALAGRPVDRPPFTVWYHFGNQHAPAAVAAQVQLTLRALRPDLLKMMNDYDYPMPAGLDVMATPADLGARASIRRARPSASSPGQGDCRPGAQGQGLVDTVFNA
jgi:uroporphyrinogen decarboxylase